MDSTDWNNWGEWLRRKVLYMLDTWRTLNFKLGGQSLCDLMGDQIHYSTGENETTPDHYDHAVGLQLYVSKRLSSSSWSKLTSISSSPCENGSLALKGSYTGARANQHYGVFQLSEQPVFLTTCIRITNPLVIVQAPQYALSLSVSDTQAHSFSGIYLQMARIICRQNLTHVLHTDFCMKPLFLQALIIPLYHPIVPWHHCMSYCTVIAVSNNTAIW